MRPLLFIMLDVIMLDLITLDLCTIRECCPRIQILKNAVTPIGIVGRLPKLAIFVSPIPENNRIRSAGLLASRFDFAILDRSIFVLRGLPRRLNPLHAE